MSIGTSFKTIDVSAFFTALMMRDVRRGILNMRSNDFMTWRLYFVLAVLIMVFAFAHILALQKLNALQRVDNTIAVGLRQRRQAVLHLGDRQLRIDFPQGRDAATGFGFGPDQHISGAHGPMDPGR